MKTWQKIGFPLIILALLLVIIFFWGSVASVLSAFAILLSLLVYIWNRFIIPDRDNDFDDYD